MKGIDYAWGGPRGSAAALKAAGYGFIARYLGHDSSKNLAASEKSSALAHGLKIIVVFEDTATRMLSGRAAGVADAQLANSQVNALGMKGAVIYFAADFDASAGQQAAINAYLDGAASVIGRDRVGIYAGYYPVKRAMDAGKAKFGWQTYAWSGGQWSQAQLRQTHNDINVLGYAVDLDESVKTDFGQWPRPSDPPPPPPPPPPTDEEIMYGEIPSDGTPIVVSWLSGTISQVVAVAPNWDKFANAPTKLTVEITVNHMNSVPFVTTMDVPAADGHYTAVYKFGTGNDVNGVMLRVVAAQAAPVGYHLNK
jgi:Rv2525c-like, glycoside hydrolase-like domain